MHLIRAPEANVLAGLGTTLQTPLLATALRHLDGDFMVLLLVQLGRRAVHGFRSTSTWVELTEWTLWGLIM